MSSGAVEKRIDELDRIIFLSIARRREAVIEAGRAFSELKQLLGHGRWQKHFRQTFADSGICLRTAERWMRRAAVADARSKNDCGSFFEAAADQGALAIKDAAEKAEADVNAAKLKRDHLYDLPLPLT